MTAAGLDVKPTPPLPTLSPEGERAIRFAGYAAVFDRVDRGGDVVRSGAFAASLAQRRAVPLLWQHRGDAVIGVVETLAEDARGLRVVARVTDRTAAGLVARGALTGLSFGYRVVAARGDNPRELLALDLAEVSLVAAPMQALARVVAVAPSVVIPAEAGIWTARMGETVRSRP